MGKVKNTVKEVLKFILVTIAFLSLLYFAEKIMYMNILDKYTRTNNNSSNPFANMFAPTYYKINWLNGIIALIIFLTSIIGYYYYIQKNILSKTERILTKLLALCLYIVIYIGNILLIAIYGLEIFNVILIESFSLSNFIIIISLLIPILTLIVDFTKCKQKKNYCISLLIVTGIIGGIFLIANI